MDSEFILYLNMTLGRELLVLHTTPAMLSKFPARAWKSCGGFKDFISVQ